MDQQLSETTSEVRAARAPSVCQNHQSGASSARCLRDGSTAPRALGPWSHAVHVGHTADSSATSTPTTKPSRIATSGSAQASSPRPRPFNPHGRVPMPARAPPRALAGR
jgi:hypothetical protein